MLRNLDKKNTDLKTALDTEAHYYERIEKNLLRYHRGRWAVIIGRQLIGIFEEPQEAYRNVVKKYGNIPMFIKRILLNEETEPLKLDFNRHFQDKSKRHVRR